MKIDHFFLKQLKKNLNILLIFLVNFILLVFLIIFINNNSTFFDKQKDILTNEISLLRKKKDFILFAKNLKNKNLDLDRVNKVLFSLIPESEDYFSIILALEEISKKTNYLITSYSLDLNNSSSNRLSIAVSGIGNRDNFLNFIKNYRFSGGRLVTIEKLEFSESNLGGEKKIYLNFYIDKKDKINDTFYKVTQSDIDLINKILSSFRFEGKVNIIKENEAIIDYETKTNPF